MDENQLKECKARNPSNISKMNTSEQIDSFLQRFFYNVDSANKEIILETANNDVMFKILKMFEEKFTLLENRIENLEKGVK